MTPTIFTLGTEMLIVSRKFKPVEGYNCSVSPSNCTPGKHTDLKTTELPYFYLPGFYDRMFTGNTYIDFVCPY